MPDNGIRRKAKYIKKVLSELVNLTYKKIVSIAISAYNNIIKISEILRVFWAFLKNALLVALLIWIGIFVYSEYNTDYEIIEDFLVPKELVEVGYSSEVVINKITDFMNSM